MPMTMSPDAIQKGTRASWDEWLAYFDEIGATNLSHAEIARKTGEDGRADGWWSQMMTVQFEQHIGRRVPGQDCEGTFTVSVSKSLPGDMDSALDWWLNAVDGRTEFSDVPISRGPDVTRTEKWRYWRCGLADGSRVVVNIYDKSPGKSALSVQHEKIESTEQAEHWRQFWKDFLLRASSR